MHEKFKEVWKIDFGILNLALLILFVALSQIFKRFENALMLMALIQIILGIRLVKEKFKTDAGWII